ncbi:hypothetical protein [Aggregatibacter kilianii]|uniref:hypothetical protein n=1 Tax=Aggregatibacter kilianii TaxID=2025884 RepID=UPI001EF8EFD6|nr:hypothetical protein [Aggregatibacter kilianii]
MKISELITTALCAIIGGIMMLYAVALIALPAHANNSTDYYDNDVSEQISKEWQRQASLEFGDIPRELTAEELRYMEAYTAQKQKELDEVKNGK